MANRTFTTPDAVESAFKFLSPDGNPDTYVKDQLEQMVAKALNEASILLVSKAKEALNSPDAVSAIEELRKLLA